MIKRKLLIVIILGVLLIVIVFVARQMHQASLRPAQSVDVAANTNLQVSHEVRRESLAENVDKQNNVEHESSRKFAVVPIQKYSRAFDNALVFAKIAGGSDIEAQQYAYSVHIFTERLNALRLSHVKSVNFEGSGFAIEFKPFEAEGASLRAEFEADAISRLGKDRYELIDAKIGSQVDLMMGNFGVMNERFMVSLDPDAEGYYQIRVESGVPSERIEEYNKSHTALGYAITMRESESTIEKSQVGFLMEYVGRLRNQKRSSH